MHFAILGIGLMLLLNFIGFGDMFAPISKSERENKCIRDFFGYVFL